MRVKINRLNFLLLPFVTLLIMFGVQMPAFAQTVSGTIQGRIVDANEAVVPGATIVIRNIETGQERTLTSNDEGI